MDRAADISRMADLRTSPGEQTESGATSIGSQGNQRAEYSSWDQCEKNPGHKSFTSVSEFTVEHIPQPYRNTVFYRYILAIASLTARLSVKYVSPKRPEGYVLSKFRGRNVTHMGSGFVIGVEDFTVDSQCVCPDCVDSPEKGKKGWRVILRTAAHLVFNNEEAAKTIVDLFYDNQHRREEMRTLYGIEVVKTDIVEDVSEIACVTHDEDTYQRLKANLDEFEQSGKEQNEQPLSPGRPTIQVIVSHPHGSSKQISFKEQVLYDDTPFCLLQAHQALRQLHGQPLFTIAVPSFGGRLGLVRSVKSPDHLKADGTEESEMINIEIKVEFPDGEISHQNIWMLKDPVRKSKEFLLRTAGLDCGHPEEFVLVLKMPQIEDVVMDDDRDMSDYIGDLSEASSLKFKLRSEVIDQ